jgi:hypothetical protein
MVVKEMFFANVINVKKIFKDHFLELQILTLHIAKEVAMC